MKKKLLKFLIFVFMLSNLEGNSLKEEQSIKLNSPVVNLIDHSFNIKEFNQINFFDDIEFNRVKLKKLIIKTEATMKKDTIHKEQFIAITSTLSDQIIQSIFINPQYVNDMESIELLTYKPDSVNLTISMDFTKEGINTLISDGKMKQKRFIRYSDMFKYKVR